LIFQFFAEFWYKMPLQEVGVYLPYVVINSSRQFLKPDNRIVDIPYLSAGSVWRLRYLLCLIGRQG
jgi:NADH dehydrogenase